MMSDRGSDEVFEIKEELDTNLKKEYNFEWEEN